MNRFGRMNVYLTTVTATAATLLLFASGCGDGNQSEDVIEVIDVAENDIVQDASDDTFDPVQHVIMKPSVIVVSEQSGVVVLGRDEEGNVLVENNAAGQALKVGDIVVAQPGDGNVFAKIDAVEPGPTGIRLTTSIPTISDVFDEARIRVPLATDFAGATFDGDWGSTVEIVESPVPEMSRSLRAGDSLGGTAVQQSVIDNLNQSKTVKIPLPSGRTLIGGTVEDPFDNEITMQVKIVSGTVEIQPAGYFYSDDQSWIDCELDARVKVTMRLSAEISGALSLDDFDFEKSPLFYGEIPIGVPPVWVSLALRASMDVDVKVEGGISVEWDQEVETVQAVFVNWEKGDLMPDISRQGQFDVSSGDPVFVSDVGLTIKGGPKLELSVRPFSVVGLGVSLGLYSKVKFGAGSTLGYSWDLGWALLLGLDGDFFADISALGFEIAKIKQQLFEIEEPVFSEEWLGQCVPDCTGLECGSDPVCGVSCGTCDDGYTCQSGECVEDACVPACGTAVCGPDPVCGQSCGTCDDGYTCQSGECVEDACVPACGTAVCGMDPVCGTLSCGTCDDGYHCQSGQCLENVVSGEMVLIPAGSFWMGCNATVDSQCEGDESPYHEVTLSGFYMDKTEVTQSEYKKCIDAGECDTPSCIWDPTGTPNRPVVCVNWTQAGEYCAWAGKRLPTEAEWEKAARGTDGRKYPWGNETATCEYAVMYEGSNGCGTGTTWDVCGKSPSGDSPYGLCDMSGNVWEWVSDWYDSDYYTNSPSSNPTNTVSGSGRVMRGGSFDYGHYYYGLRASYRLYDDPSYGDGHDLGFRCARPQ